MSREEMSTYGWKHLDILLVSGDAYVDHPSFGIALLGRWLVQHGFTVGIAAQIPWGDQQTAIQALQCMGRPRLFTGITAGAIDSMLAHYTAFRKKRRDDAYTPGGQAGARPNRASIVYTGLVRQAFPHMPVVLGGIEASLRRAVHYDFWSNSLRRSILIDSKADILVYGMAERALLSLAQAASRLQHKENPPQQVESSLHKHTTQAHSGSSKHSIAATPPHVDPRFRLTLAAAARTIPGTVTVLASQEEKVLTQEASQQRNLPLVLPSYATILAQPTALMQASLLMEQQVHQGRTALIQHIDDKTLYISAPQPILSQEEMDTLYALPYTRLPHPSYKQAIPAWEMIRTSITTHRGCGGGCSFCSLALHQGRRISSRSQASILNEARHFDSCFRHKGTTPRWAGSVSDVGGPSANMWQAQCTLANTTCQRSSCLHPTVCRFFHVNQQDGAKLLATIQALPSIRHVRVASGVRFDLAILDRSALYAYTSEFTGGQLKVAPEHIVPEVLDLMRKPSLKTFCTFLDIFYSHSAHVHKEQYTVPYLMSAFPGCTDQHMHELASWLRQRNWQPQQVQCFIPTPGTIATAMFYAKVDSSLRPLYVATSDADRLRQHHILMGSHRSTARKQPLTHKKLEKRTQNIAAHKPAQARKKRHKHL